MATSTVQHGRRVTDVGGPSAEELWQRARASALLIAVTALLVVPAWSAFDLALEPDQARAFITLRLACDVPVLVAVLVLWRGRPRRPAAYAFGVLLVVQLEIAWMVSRAADSRPFYLLGFTLALYGCGLLLVGSVWWTVGLVAVTAAAFGVLELAAPERMSHGDLLAAATYLGTASLIGVLSHVQRQRLTARELAFRTRLEQEQSHVRALLTKVERLSREDPLTGVANRRSWDEQLTAACEQARTAGEPLAVVLLDIDRFKEINDRLGHAGGDEALRWVAEVMLRRAPDPSLVARLGGDELGILLPGMLAADAAALAERVRRDVQLRRIVSSSDLRATVSQGVAVVQGSVATPQALMHEADRQLYLAKETRDTVCVTTTAPGWPTPRSGLEALHVSQA